MAIDRKQIEMIIEQVIKKIPVSQPTVSLGNYDNGVNGVFQDMETMIQAAVISQKKLVQLPMLVREKIIQAIRDVGWINREKYGQMERKETEIGAVSGTMLKMENCDI